MSVSELVSMFPVFYALRMFIFVLIIAPPLDAMRSHLDRVHTFTRYF
jgi:hypothetical protein